MNKKVLGFIGLTILGLLILGFQYRNLSERYKWQQADINANFNSTLDIARDSFATNLKSVGDGNSPAYYYNRAMSNLYAASCLSSLTSYYKNNKGLTLALDNLYKVMEEGKYKSGVIDKSKLVYDSLLKLTRNPQDKDAVNNIANLTNEIKKGK